MATSSFSSLALFVVVVAYSAAVAFAATHVVGANQRWDIPTSSSDNYTNWANGQSFAVGDSLVFNFPTGAHDVYEVSKSSYENCNKQNPLAKYETGPATVPLNSSGLHYYICAVGGHCSAGQKMTVNVRAASSPTTPSAPAPTSGGAPTSGTPNPPEPSPGPSGSGSGSGSPPGSRPPTSAAPPTGLGKAATATVALTACAAALLL